MILNEVLEGPRDLERLPSQLIGPESGILTLILDKAAAALSARDRRRRAVGFWRGLNDSGGRRRRAPRSTWRCMTLPTAT